MIPLSKVFQGAVLDSSFPYFLAQSIHSYFRSACKCACAAFDRKYGHECSPTLSSWNKRHIRLYSGQCVRTKENEVDWWSTTPTLAQFLLRRKIVFYKEAFSSFTLTQRAAGYACNCECCTMFPRSSSVFLLAIIVSYRGHDTGTVFKEIMFSMVRKLSFLMWYETLWKQNILLICCSALFQRIKHDEELFHTLSDISNLSTKTVCNIWIYGARAKFVVINEALLSLCVEETGGYSKIWSKLW